jgi:hypothetical protein
MPVLLSKVAKAERHIHAAIPVLNKLIHDCSPEVVRSWIPERPSPFSVFAMRSPEADAVPMPVFKQHKPKMPSDTRLVAIFRPKSDFVFQ